MRRHVAKLVLAMGAALVVSSAAYANSVTYDFKGSADGDLAGSPFSGASFDIKAVGDTSAATLLPVPPFATNTWDNFPTSLTVDLTGHGTLNVTDPGYVFDSQDVSTTQGLAGIGTFNVTSSDFLYLLGPAILKTYKLVTSLAPVTGFAFLANQNGPAQMDTDQGVLTFTDVRGVSFSATVSAAPEPQAWAMMILGLGVIGAAARRRRVSRPA
jgi:hypothetical protein